MDPNESDEMKQWTLPFYAKNPKIVLIQQVESVCFFFNRNKGSALSLGLAEVVELRPEDPIEHLAKFLYQHGENVRRRDDRVRFAEKRNENFFLQENFFEETRRREKIRLVSKENRNFNSWRKKFNEFRWTNRKTKKFETKIFNDCYATNFVRRFGRNRWAKFCWNRRIRNSSSSSAARFRFGFIFFRNEKFLSVFHFRRKFRQIFDRKSDFSRNEKLTRTNGSRCGRISEHSRKCWHHR